MRERAVRDADRPGRAERREPARRAAARVGEGRGGAARRARVAAQVRRWVAILVISGTTTSSSRRC